MDAPLSVGEVDNAEKQRKSQQSTAGERTLHDQTGCQILGIRPYEPNVVKAAWNIFGKSYEYRKKYSKYKEKRREMEKMKVDEISGQMSFWDFPEVIPEEMKEK